MFVGASNFSFAEADPPSDIVKTRIIHHKVTMLKSEN